MIWFEDKSISPTNKYFKQKKRQTCLSVFFVLKYFQRGALRDDVNQSFYYLVICFKSAMVAIGSCALKT